MSRQKQYQLRSRRNGLIIPIPAHNQGIIPRFGIEDNQMIFAPAHSGDREPSKMPMDTTTVKMGSVDNTRVVPGPRSTLSVEDGAAPAPAPRARKATKGSKGVKVEATPEVATPASGATPTEELA